MNPIDLPSLLLILFVALFFELCDYWIKRTGDDNVGLKTSMKLLIYSIITSVLIFTIILSNFVKEEDHWLATLIALLIFFIVTGLWLLVFSLQSKKYRLLLTELDLNMDRYFEQTLELNRDSNYLFKKITEAHKGDLFLVTSKMGKYLNRVNMEILEYQRLQYVNFLDELIANGLPVDEERLALRMWKLVESCFRLPRGFPALLIDFIEPIID